MSAVEVELMGWLVSVVFLAVLLGLILWSFSKRKTAFDEVPWREAVAMVLGLFLIGLIALLIPQAAAVLFGSGEAAILLSYE